MQTQQNQSSEEAQILEKRAAELAEKEAQLESREQVLEEKEQVVQRRMRDNLYDKITVSTKTMDRVIFVLVAVLVICLVVGIWQGTAA